MSRGWVRIVIGAGLFAAFAEALGVVCYRICARLAGLPTL